MGGVSSSVYEPRLKSARILIHSPSPKVLSGITRGSFVKVSNGKELFWVSVTNVNGSKITGNVDNHIHRSRNYGFGSVIRFHTRYVYAVRSNVNTG